jgi:DNA invertase Pin-like site-specific DNA recombinase
MGAIHEFDRALIKERQREGIALAKKRGGIQGTQEIVI